MKNYIKGELYKAVRNRYLFVITFVLGIGIIASTKIITNIPLLSNSFIATRSGILSIGIMLGIGINVLLLVFLPIFTEDFRNNTFKNIINLNLSKWQIFLAKYIVQIIAALFVAIILFSCLGVALIMLPPGEGYTNEMLIEFLFKLIASIPCFAATIAIMDLLALVIKKELVICLIYYYVYIQIYAIITFMNGNINNTLARVILMPAQVGYMFNNNFSIKTCMFTALSGLLYIILVVTIYSRLKIERVKIYS